MRILIGGHCGGAKLELGKSWRPCRFCRAAGFDPRAKSLICFGFAIGRYGPRFAEKVPDPYVLLREFSVQSVVSISPLDPRSTPAPDRKDTGSDSDSFSQMLDVVAKPSDDPAPEAAPSSPPSSGDQSSPAPGKTASPPTDGSSAQPQDDSGKTSASSARPGGNASKTGEATAEDKNSGKGSKQTSKDDGAKDATQAVVAIDPTQGAPQTGTVAVAAALVALDAPKPDGADNSNDASGIRCARNTKSIDRGVASCAIGAAAKGKRFRREQPIGGSRRCFSSRGERRTDREGVRASRKIRGCGR
jgi:hypothetical protein